MAFGTLGTTASAALSNVKDVLGIMQAMGAMPEQMKTEFTALMQTIVDRDAAVAAREAAVAAKEQEAEQMMTAARAEQSALDMHKEQLRKLIG